MTPKLSAAVGLVVLVGALLAVLAGHVDSADARCRREQEPCGRPPADAETANLAVTADGPASTTRGDDAVYTFTVANHGDITARGVELEVDLPAGATYVRASSPCASAPDGPGSMVTCTLGTRDTSEHSTVSMTIRPTVDGALTVHAIGRSDTPEADPSDDEADFTTQVGAPPRPIADLAAQVTDSPDPVTVGEELTYHVGVTNRSVAFQPQPTTGDFAAPAHNARITDVLPAGVELVRTSRPADCAGTTTVTCALGDINPEASATVDIVVRATSAGTIANSVTATSDTADPDAGNNSATASTDAQPTVSIADTTTTEGTGGTTDATFHVSLSVPAAATTTIQVRTYDGSAKAPDDYAGFDERNITFAPGEQTQDVTVQVAGDSLDEPDETYGVSIHNASGATIADGDATGTITDDDAEPALSVGDVSVTEGNVDQAPATFTVELSQPSGFPVDVEAQTHDGTATADSEDYTATTARVSIPAGATSATVTVPVIGDTRLERDEDFTVALGDAHHATIGDGTGQATIVNDDNPGDPPDTRITSGPGDWSATPTPSFALRASEREDTFECRVVPDDFQPCATPFRTRPLADGEHTVEVRAIKREGDLDIRDNTPAHATFTVDTVAPTTTIAAAPPALTNNPTPVFELRSNEPLAHFECRVSATDEFAACSSREQVARLSEGEHVFEARAVDPAGNADATPASHRFTVDTIPPDTRIGAARGPAMAPTVSGSGAGGNRVAVGGDGQAMLAVGCPADAGASCSGDLALDANGVRIGQSNFDVAPGKTETIPVDLPANVQARVERSGALKVVATTTIDGLAAKRAAARRAARVVAREDMVLTPDPRTPRVVDAGRTLRPRGAAVAIRLACPLDRRAGCSGRVRILAAGGELGSAGFKLRAGRKGTAKVALTTAARRLLRARRELEATVEVATRQPGARSVVKRIQINLRGGRR